MKRTINKKAIIGIVGILFLVCSLISVLGTYETGNALESNDSKDTTTKSLEVTVDGKSLKKIQTTVDGQTVNFLPAYIGWRCPYKFYKKNNDGTFTDIMKGVIFKNMQSLAIMIKAAGPENVYTDATNATFYGTIDKSWIDTFWQRWKDGHGDSGVAFGLTPSSIKALDTAGVKTVYFANNSDRKEKHICTGNWDYATTREPQLGTVGYNTFYNAYRDLLSSKARRPWSSYSTYVDWKLAANHAYCWCSDECCWQYFNIMVDSNAVVLTKAF